MKPAVASGGQGETSNSVHNPHGRTVTVPVWSPRISDRVAWCVWLLETHPEIYGALKERADARRSANPNARISIDNILQNLRWNTDTRADQDLFKLNNNARALFARLYRRERPGAKLETRRSWLDTLHADEWARILAALHSAEPQTLEGGDQ